MNPSARWYVMTPSGAGGLAASFGPFNDLALARIADGKLKIAGIKSVIFGEQAAKDDDIHGVSALIIKHPKGIDWE